MHPAEVRQLCPPDETGLNLICLAMQQLQLSARAYHRVLKLARPIADLVGMEQIQPAHLAETLQFRPRMEIGYNTTPIVHRLNQLMSILKEHRGQN